MYFTLQKQFKGKNITLLTEESKRTIEKCLNLRRESDLPQYRLDDICNGLPKQFDLLCHGYHRSCYARFTNVKFSKKRKSDDEVDDETAGPSKPKRTASLTCCPLLPKDKCIFCDKKREKIVSKGLPLYEKLVKCVTKTAEYSITEAAKTKKCSVFSCYQGMDLVAREAHYHEACRKDFVRTQKRHSKPLCGQNAETERIQAHENAFTYICTYIEQSLIISAQVERMSMLEERYCEYMQQNSPTFYNSNYKTCKLKEKLIKHFGNKLKFWSPNMHSELVYCDNLPRGQAVEAAFELAASEEKQLEECAHILHRHINDAFKAAPNMPWPPSAEYLNSRCP